MKSHLKVKVHAMSTEMTHIRRMEEKWKKKARYARQRVTEFAKVANKLHVEAHASQTYAENNFWSLRNHRKGMKPEARISHLAYGCIRGVPYSKMEQLCYGVFKGYGSSEPDWKRIEFLVGRFTKDEPTPQEYMQRYAQWVEEAQKWYNGNKHRIQEVTAERQAEKLRRDKDEEYQFNRRVRHKEMETLGRMAHDLIKQQRGVAQPG
jgi:hypothetical protein